MKMELNTRKSGEVEIVESGIKTGNVVGLMIPTGNLPGEVKGWRASFFDQTRKHDHAVYGTPWHALVGVAEADERLVDLEWFVDNPEPHWESPFSVSSKEWLWGDYLLTPDDPDDNDQWGVKHLEENNGETHLCFSLPEAVVKARALTKQNDEEVREFERDDRQEMISDEIRLIERSLKRLAELAD